MRATVFLPVALLLGTAQPARAEPARKDPGLAAGLSLGVTAASIAFGLATTGHDTLTGVAAVGILVGPSTGQWYAHRIGIPGLAARLVGGVLVVDGFAHLDGGSDCLGAETAQECDAINARDDRDRSRGGVEVAVGTVLFVGAIVFDAVTAARHATDWNRRHVAVSPVAIPSPAGHSTPALALRITF